MTSQKPTARPAARVTAGVLALTLAMVLAPATAMAHMLIEGAAIRAVLPSGPTAAGYMQITNHAALDDMILAAHSASAERIELHDTVEDADGVMRMVHLADGIEIDAGETVTFAPGGLHLMFIGLTEPFEPGTEIEITIEFMFAAPVTVTATVGAMTGGMGHGGGGHSAHGDDS